jgi:hypothetical protein
MSSGSERHVVKHDLHRRASPMYVSSLDDEGRWCVWYVTITFPLPRPSHHHLQSISKPSFFSALSSVFLLSFFCSVYTLYSTNISLWASRSHRSAETSPFLQWTSLTLTCLYIQPRYRTSMNLIIFPRRFRRYPPKSSRHCVVEIYTTSHLPGRRLQSLRRLSLPYGLHEYSCQQLSIFIMC